MGSMQASEFANMGVDLHQAMVWHLRSNHYPPVPYNMVPVCIAAIDAYNEDDADRFIELPEGATWRGYDEAPAWAIIEGHHLEPWLSGDDES